VPVRDPDEDEIDNNNHDIQGHVDQRCFCFEIYFFSNDALTAAKEKLKKADFGEFWKDRANDGTVSSLYKLKFRDTCENVCKELLNIFASIAMQPFNIRLYQDAEFSVFLDSRGGVV